jgi:Trypsin-like peptidase domain
MDKIVVSPEDVASVRSPAPSTLGPTPQLPSPVPPVLRFGLPFLVPVLPLLCLATIAVWITVRAREPRVQNACLRYCCALLVMSGFLWTVFLAIVFLWPSAPREIVGAAPPIQISPASEAQPGPAPISAQLFVVTRDRKGRRQTIENLSDFGTTFLLYAGKDDYLFVTSRHVLDGEDWENRAPFRGNALLLDRTGGKSTARIVARHKNLDLMLLRVPRTEAGPPFVQDILEFDQIAQGERIMIFGHPEGLFFSLADGLVSRLEEPSLIQITAPVSPGASGGPVFDFQGRLLGVVTSMLDKRRSPYSENLNFAVAADSLLDPTQWDASPEGLSTLREYKAARTESKNAAAVPASHP